MTPGRRDRVRVADLMTRDVYTLTPTETLPFAESMMGMLRIRHIPVVDDLRSVVGLVTHRDLLGAKISSLAPLTDDERTRLQLSVPVSRLMRTNVWTIAPDALALTAARIMREHRYGCLPVVDDKRLVGIVTEADLLTLLTESLDLRVPSQPPAVEDAMTPAPTTIASTASVAHARSLMTRFGVHHLPVVDERGLPVSMITDRDLRVAEAIVAITAVASTAHVVSLMGTKQVSPRAALHSVVRDMVRDRVDAVLVVEQGRLLGILTATDACRLFAEHLHDEHTLTG